MSGNTGLVRAGFDIAHDTYRSVDLRLRHVVKYRLVNVVQKPSADGDSGIGDHGLAVIVKLQFPRVKYTVLRCVRGHFGRHERFLEFRVPNRIPDLVPEQSL